MSNAKVVTHARFGAVDRLKELREQGIMVVEETRGYGDISLPEPEYGETIIGELDEAEKALFFAMYDATSELEDMTRTFMGRQLSRVGQRITDSDRARTLEEAMRDLPDDLAFDSDTEAKEFFRLEKRKDMLHSTFHWNLAERFDRHEYILGVRSRGRVVTAKRKF